MRCFWAAWKARAGPWGILPLTLLVALLTTMMTHTGLTAKQFWLFLAFAVAAAATVKRQIVVKVKTVSAEDIPVVRRKILLRNSAIAPRRRSRIRPS
jgi:hypothetical protein